MYGYMFYIECLDNDRKWTFLLKKEKHTDFRVTTYVMWLKNCTCWNRFREFQLQMNYDSDAKKLVKTWLKSVSEKHKSRVIT